MGKSRPDPTPYFWKIQITVLNSHTGSKFTKNRPWNPSPGWTNCLDSHISIFYSFQKLNMRIIRMQIYQAAIVLHIMHLPCGAFFIICYPAIRLCPVV